MDFTPSNLDIPEDDRKRVLGWSNMEVMMGRPSKVRGKRLDQLCDDNVFYVESAKNGFLIVEGCTAAYFSTLTPVELIELGTELVQAGAKAIRWEPS